LAVGNGEKGNRELEAESRGQMADGGEQRADGRERKALTADGRERRVETKKHRNKKTKKRKNGAIGFVGYFLFASLPVLPQIALPKGSQ
jgi:hypothetical protein